VFPIERELSAKYFVIIFSFPLKRLEKVAEGGSISFHDKPEPSSEPEDYALDPDALLLFNTILRRNSAGC
jgi:hypothetical protein